MERGVKVEKDRVDVRERRDSPRGHDRGSDREHDRDYDRGRDRNDRPERSREDRDHKRDRSPRSSMNNSDNYKKYKARNVNQGIDESKLEWGKKADASSSEEDSADKEKPNFKPSGLLLKDLKTNSRGIEAKYLEPADAGNPTLQWRLYPFKGTTPLEKIEIFKKSYYLLGKERKIVDIPTDHPTCSRQHAVIQFRTVTVTDGDSTLKMNKPYIMDLESTNGTFLNGSKVEALRYVELLEQDVLKFGESSREYVLLHTESY